MVAKGDALPSTTAYLLPFPGRRQRHARCRGFKTAPMRACVRDEDVESPPSDVIAEDVGRGRGNHFPRR